MPVDGRKHIIPPPGPNNKDGIPVDPAKDHDDPVTTPEEKSTHLSLTPEEALKQFGVTDMSNKADVKSKLPKGVFIKPVNKNTKIETRTFLPQDQKYRNLDKTYEDYADEFYLSLGIHTADTNEAFDAMMEEGRLDEFIKYHIDFISTTQILSSIKRLADDYGRIKQLNRKMADG